MRADRLLRSACLVAVAVPSIAAGAPAPRLSIPEIRHDFGEVTSGTVLKHAFEVRNTGDGPVTLELSSISLPGVQVAKPREIAAGETRTIGVVWPASGIEGPVELELQLASDDPELPAFSLYLKAEIYPEVSVRPMSAAYFSVWRGDAAEQRLEIVVRGEPPASIVGLDPEGEHFTAAVRTVEEGSRHELLIRVPAGTAPGRYRERLVLRTDHPRFPEVPVAVNVFVKEELYVGPEEIELGELPKAMLSGRPDLAELVNATLVVTRRHGEFRIVALESDLPGLVLRSEPDGQPSRVFTVAVGIDAERLQVGPIDGRVVIRTTDERFPELTVPVRGSVVP